MTRMNRFFKENWWLRGTVLAVLSIVADWDLAWAESPERPNVVFIVVDDLGATDLGCYGSEFHETPRIDALAKRAVRFSNFYSAHPVCSPTRASLMTGKSPQRLGITDWIPQPSEIHLPHQERTIAETFSESGYRTGFIGKWHLGENKDQLPLGHGFEWQKCVNRAGQPGGYFFPFKGKQRNGVAYWDVPDLEEQGAGSFLTDGLTDQAIQFISKQKNEPFFLCVWYYAVHTPIQAPEAVVEKYAGKREAMYGDSETPFENEGNGARSRSRQDNPTYGAMVEKMDQNVGRILDHLDELGLTDSTIVVFSSDNGGLSTLVNRVGPTSVAPLRAGKGWNYEGGIKIPTLISWPNKIEPGVSSTPAISMDFYPTLLALTGQELMPQQHLDGVSLTSQLLNTEKASPTREELANRPLVWHYPHKHGSGHRPSSAIRVGNWKLINRVGQARDELYDLEADPGEEQDLSEREPDVAEDLRARLDAELTFNSEPKK